MPVSDRRQVVIAVNPHAGAQATRIASEHLASVLRELHFEVTIETDIDKLTEIATDNPELRCVVAAGGDGTIGLLVNRLPPHTPFTILPQGTENLLAKHLKIPFEPEAVAAMIAEGISAKLDAGRANGQLFLIMASCGFDAEVVRLVHLAREGNISHWAYAKPIFESIRKYKYPTLSIYCDDEKKPVKAKWSFVFNVPRYAMGLPIADQADAMDGHLDLCAFRGGNLLNGLLYLVGILLRRHRRWKDTRVEVLRKIRIEAEAPVPYQIDGDPGGFLPLEIEVVPQRLNIIVPKKWAGQHGISNT
ncbi:MAG: protein BmrU [Planctomycetaceae bacterium]|nr:protein BmrU [Planctomycetaceae bacterium]MCP4462190.1 protein BmrU [Planctomycetaceae bacterium]MDG1807714.1 diacylglycerol kinase family protein [Pirellulaceae bacterium]MDG2103821.1 diacylglycerol kinase family protein [Pirellulaceae bacterium]